MMGARKEPASRATLTERSLSNASMPNSHGGAPACSGAAELHDVAGTGRRGRSDPASPRAAAHRRSHCSRDRAPKPAFEVGGPPLAALARSWSTQREIAAGSTIGVSRRRDDAISYSKQRALQRSVTTLARSPRRAAASPLVLLPLPRSRSIDLLLELRRCGVFATPCFSVAAPPQHWRGDR